MHRHQFIRRKNMKKLFSLLLALVLVFSLIPTMAAAETDPAGESAPATSVSSEETTKETKKKRKKDKKKDDQEEDKEDKEDQDKKDKHKRDKHKKKPHTKHHKPEQHKYNSYGCNTNYHWLECACGCKISVEPHVDPKNADDDCCFCGYQFSDNADLVTLWIDGCPPIKGFNKDKTEYKLNAYTYKDVKEIKVSTCTFDSEATVELPEDLTLKEGENKFEIKVTSENQKVTKIYTVIITKEAKK